MGKGADPEERVRARRTHCIGVPVAPIVRMRRTCDLEPPAAMIRRNCTGLSGCALFVHAGGSAASEVQWFT